MRSSTLPLPHVVDGDKYFSKTRKVSARTCGIFMPAEYPAPTADTIVGVHLKSIATGETFDVTGILKVNSNPRERECWPTFIQVDLGALPTGMKSYAQTQPVDVSAWFDSPEATALIPEAGE